MNHSNQLTDRSDRILEGVLAGERLTPEEALWLYEEADFLKIQWAARELRNRKNDPNAVTYTIFQMVNYSTYCDVDCSFCSFYEPYDSPRGQRLSAQQVVAKMQAAVAAGADQMFLQGGVDRRIPFDYYLQLIRAVKEEVGAHIHIRAFSPVELLGMEEESGLSLRQLLGQLKDAGLDSVPGAGAEILTERMRRILSPKKASVSEWLRVMETCHEEGLPGSANIVFGSEESRAEVIEHLGVIRDLQDRSGAILSFIPWTFQQQTKKFYVRPVAAPEYIKVLGLCRLFLDNIDHIETSLMVLGPGVGSIALHGGADDISSVVLEENVLRSYGLRSEEKARQFIHQAGFKPLRRNLLYETYDEKVCDKKNYDKDGQKFKR